MEKVADFAKNSAAYYGAGALLAGLMANPIFFAGAKLTDFKMEITGVLVFLLLLVLGPVLIFHPA